MQRKIYHGTITPTDLAEALLAEFNRGNLRTQALGNADQMAVQITTRSGSPSGGQTALTISISKVEDGIMVDVGQQAWLGVAASLGQTAFSVMRNPLNLLHRLDDLAQDIESIQLSERVWAIIEDTMQRLGASHQLSERLKRIDCAYCGSANPLGQASCLACGAPFGDTYPTTCPYCGFAVLGGETTCPHCQKRLQ